MSEQIVEVLDNDRRAQREGTSKTGNLLVIGRKGSGKTVLAVDIVKAIQKQRSLKQGKVAIVTGESLNSEAARRSDHHRACRKIECENCKRVKLSYGEEDRRIALCTGRSEKTSGASDDSKPGIQEEVQF